MNFYRLLSVITAAALWVFPAEAQNQQPQTPEQREKQLMEFIDGEVQRLSKQLNLEFWQEFYVDSTLTHDWKAMQAEMEKMSAAKVENPDLYVGVQDKWMEQIDRTYKQRIFTEEQWKKYWKNGAKKAQEARDKRKNKK